MLNLVGDVPATERLLAIPGAHVHLYDKAPRPRRKLGHVNVIGSDPAAVRVVLDQAEAVVASGRAE
jgi:5-(carboxyamino)imidazole ribonucleotide synthase